MNKKVAQIAGRVADSVLKSMDAFVQAYAEKTGMNRLDIMIALREGVVQGVGAELQPILYPEFCPGCGDRLCPTCGEHMTPPMLETAVDAESWDVCFDCGLYVKDDGSQVVIPSVGSQDARVLQYQAQKRASRSYLN